MKDDISGPSLASAALRIHQGRMRVSVENIANARSTASAPDGEPYRRKIAVFEPITGNTEEAPAIRIVRDKTEFPTVHSPGHPAADAGGNLKLPNVRPTVEMSELRSAMRAYEANLRTRFCRRLNTLGCVTFPFFRAGRRDAVGRAMDGA